jgi:hypothetical protein
MFPHPTRYSHRPQRCGVGGRGGCFRTQPGTPTDPNVAESEAAEDAAVNLSEDALNKIKNNAKNLEQREFLQHLTDKVIDIVKENQDQRKTTRKMIKGVLSLLVNDIVRRGCDVR